MFAYCNNAPVSNEDQQGKSLKSLVKTLFKKLKPVVDKHKKDHAEDRGTLSIGQSFSGTPSFWNFNIQFALSFDTKGNVALQKTKVGGVITGNPSLSTATFLTVTNAPSVEELNGRTVQVGGSVSNKIPYTPINAYAGGEVVIAAPPEDNSEKETYWGGSLFTGISFPPDEDAEVHAEWGTTNTIGKVNLYELFDAAYNLVMGW